MINARIHVGSIGSTPQRVITEGRTQHAKAPSGVTVTRLGNARGRTHRVTCNTCGTKWDGTRVNGLEAFDAHVCSVQTQ